MKKNRSTLKDYFKKGAIPTESNFADLIDSMLNQEEDSISKLPNDPLKITAIGVDEALVNFYRIDKNAEQLSWQVKQKLGGVAGLSISDTVGSRLFIENGTGNVGIGTTTPASGARLHVSGGQIQLDGNQKISFSDTDTSNNLKLQLYSGYGLGINNGILFYAANGKHSWRDSAGANERMLLATGADGGLTIKGTGASSVAGSLTVGSNTPGTYKLNVTGNALFTGDYLYVSSETAGRLRVGAAWNIPGLYSGDDGTKDLILGVPANRKVYLGNGTGDTYIEGTTGNAYFKGNLGVGTAPTTYKLEVAGDISVGQKTTTPATGYGSKLYFNGASENSDAIWLARYNQSDNASSLRLNLSDDNTSDLFQIGYTYFSDSKWYTSFSVETNGNTTVAGSLSIGGNLNITGAQNIIKVKTFTLAIKNKAKDTPNTWNVDYTDQKFTEVYTVFVTLQGYSLWTNDANFGSWGHVKNTDAIPQHTFVRVTSSDLKTASGTAYTSEANADGEVDNTTLFTVIVMGRI